MEDMTFKTPGRIALMLGTAAFFATSPVEVAFNTADGIVSVTVSQALAKSGSDDGSEEDRSGKGDDDDDDDDDSDDGNSPDDPAGSGGTTDGSDDGATVRKIEVSASSVEVTYADGTKEEIENGRYERKNPAGRTVEERPATQADVDRLLALR